MGSHGHDTWDFDDQYAVQMDQENEPGVSLGVCKVIHKTEKALFVEDAEGVQLWIAKSQIHPDSELPSEAEHGDSEELLISQWLAMQKGLA